MVRHTDTEAEAEEIIRTIAQTTPEVLDGKTAVRQMKNDPEIDDSEWTRGPHTWAGAHFENYSIRTLIDQIGGELGPDFDGRSEIDYERNNLWDFKCVAMTQSSGKNKYQVKLNSQETFMNAIQKDGALGFICMRADIKYEESPEDFTFWYKEQKGQEPCQHRFTGQRARTAVELHAFFIDGVSELMDAIDEGWIKHRVSSSTGNDEYYLHFPNAKKANAPLYSYEF